MMREAREYLDQLIWERREDYASLSRMIGRNPSYIQQFIKRGTPKRLNEDDRAALARYFGVDEAFLGGRRTAQAENGRFASSDVQDAARGNAEESWSKRSSRCFRFNPLYLCPVFPSDLEDLSMRSTEDASVAPAVEVGDLILLERSCAAASPAERVYVLRLDGKIVVGRVARM